jgi:hypothetical protein
MIHRYLHDILSEGVAAIKANPGILDDLFRDNYVLVSEEAESIKQYFVDKGLAVKNGYPRESTVWPAVNIVLGEEAETDSVLAESGGLVMGSEDPDAEIDPNVGAELLASIWAHQYRLIITTEHPDVTAYYYEIVKFIMLDGIRSLMDDGCFEFEFSGNDLAPNPPYFPEHLFSRQLVFRCQRELQRYDRALQNLRATRVSGIHVDKEASLRDVGEVETNVKPYTE